MIRNDGKGVADNFRISSGQPTIVDNTNNKGLVVNFKLIATTVGSAAISPSLLVNFGKIDAGQTAVAQFLMLSSVQGTDIYMDMHRYIRISLVFIYPSPSYVYINIYISISSCSPRNLQQLLRLL